jgi:N-acetylmuramic acid 6-phosphate etherase
VEFAEDSRTQGWEDLQAYNITDKDVVVGIAASGTTPYVIGALNECRRHGIVTGSISCNPDTPVSAAADFPVEVVVGPEFVTGSTRLKSGTAQKLVLNMLSTAVMIQLGRVEDNKMVNMQLSNEKLVDRGVKMLMEQLSLTDYEQAQQLLLKAGSVKKAVDDFTGNITTGGICTPPKKMSTLRFMEGNTVSLNIPIRCITIIYIHSGMNLAHATCT